MHVALHGPWNGTALTPIIPTGTATPVNGTGGFYNELFRYKGGGGNYSGLADFDEIDAVERAGQDPATVHEMHAHLVDMITKGQRAPTPLP